MRIDRLELFLCRLPLVHFFETSFGRSYDRTFVLARMEGEGHEGWGEAVAEAHPYYSGETTETVLSALDTYGTQLPDDPFDLEEAERRWELALHRNPSARAALSSALHDLVGKRLGVPVYRLWGLDPRQAPRSTFTIGLDTPEKMRAKVHEAEQYPILKIKLGTDRDVEILRTIRDATDREIRVDANCGWTLKQTVRMLIDTRYLRWRAAMSSLRLDGAVVMRTASSRW